MAKSGKTLEDLVEEVYAITGSFAYERDDLHITEELKQQVLKQCDADAYKTFNGYAVLKRDTLDGYKYFFDNEEWLMIRASGTEPVLRLYAGGSTMQRAQGILKACRATIGA